MNRAAVGGVLALALATAAHAGVVPPLHGYDRLAYESALTATALHQLAAGDKDRVRHALAELEGLLAMTGVRAAAVDEALERTGAIGILETAAASARGADGESLMAIQAEVSRRLDWARSGAATKAVTSEAQLMMDLRTLTWHDAAEGGASWFRVDSTGSREVELYMKGCDDVRARAYLPDGRRIGGEMLLDGFAPQRIIGAPGATELTVRFDAASRCGSDWRVAFVDHEADAVLTGGEHRETPVAVASGSSWRVAPDAPGSMWIRLSGEAGTAYKVYTTLLEGDTDTAMTLWRAGTDLQIATDDDGGGGLASQVLFDTIAGGSFLLELDVKRASPGSRFELRFEETFAYKVADDILTVGEKGQRFPPSAWSGHVLRVQMEEGAEYGTLTFPAVGGTVYMLQSELDLELFGPSGTPLTPLYRDAPQEDFFIRPVGLFLASETGDTTLRVRPGAAARPWEDHPMLQFVQWEKGVPAPHAAKLGTSREEPHQLRASEEHEFDGGLRSAVLARGSGWASFEAVKGRQYHVKGDSSFQDGEVTLELFDASKRDAPSVLSARPSAMPELVFDAGRSSTYLVRVGNQAARPDRVMIGVTWAAAYDGLGVGDGVIPGKHEPIDGFDNWAPDMGGYVGRPAKIQALHGRDPAGAWLVTLDIDDGRWLWRTSALELVKRARR